jgi:hypothetical protein
MLRERSAGIPDEMDEAFGGRLRPLLGSIAQTFPSL